MSSSAAIPATIVTGGVAGLGRAISEELARRGHRVLAFGLAHAQNSGGARGLEDWRAELAKCRLGELIEIMDADVSESSDVDRVVARAIDRFGRIDGLVNNAATGPLGTVLSTEEALFDRIFDVNVKGVYLMSRSVIPHMVRQGGGSIVNIGSGAAYGKPNMAAYGASKGAVLALSAAMAYDFFHDHVRVNVAIPGGGGILSGMSLGRGGGDLEAFKRLDAPGTVAGRPADGRDLARAVAFLLSDEAAAISGTVIDVGCFAHQGGPIAAQRRALHEG